MDTPWDSLLLRRLRDDESAGAALALLVGAGSPPTLLWERCANGQVYVLVDLAARPDEGPYGAAVLTPFVPGRTVEILTVAARASFPEVALRVVSGVVDEARACGVGRVVAAASNTDLARMALLQHAGFRFSHVERDAATPAQGWNNDANPFCHRDLIWFDWDL